MQEYYKTHFDSEWNEYFTTMFAERLRKIRITAGLTQQKFASEIGISVAALSYYETGKRVPDMLFLAKIAEYFNAPYGYFLGDSISMTRENADISDKIHLTDAAIDKVRLYIEESYESTYDEEDYNILNLLLESDDFYKVLNFITWSGSESYLVTPDEDYVYFIAAKTLMDLIKKLSNNLTYKPIIQSIIKDQSEQEDFIKWMFEEIDKNSNAMRERFEQRDKRRHDDYETKYEEYKKTDRYKAVQKIKEAVADGKHNHTEE